MVRITTDDLSAYEVRKLEKNERVESFDCGDADLNDFIITEAPYYRQALLAVTYVFVHKITGQLIGYFSLANDRISVTEFEDELPNLRHELSDVGNRSVHRKESHSDTHLR